MSKRFNSVKMEQGIRLLLEGAGIALDSDFKGTPARVARMYRELLTPRKQNHVVSFPSSYGGMVVLRNHSVYTICPHHLLPVELKVSVGYIPGNKTLGLSKLGRIAESVLHKPLKQEEFTDLVAFKLYQLCDPKGCGVYVVGSHGCMKYRGIKTDGNVVTSVMRGQFLMNAATRDEFLELVRGR